MTPPRVLIIAGSDSGGGAGIQADIKTVTMLGGFAMTAVTAITAQNTLGVQAVMPVPADMVVAQIDSVVSDLGVDVVKIGMIGSAETANAVADRLEPLAVPIVFDPVMVATSGAALADEATIAAFGRLMRIAALTTPNRPELEALADMRVASDDDEAKAVMRLIDHGCRAVLAKGGHAPGTQVLVTRLDGSPRHYDTPDQAVDRLYVAGGASSPRQWGHERLNTRHTHGTGCTLASAIATEVGRGRSLVEAIPIARAFVLAALKAAPGFGQGHGPMGHAAGQEPFGLIHSKRNRDSSFRWNDEEPVE